MVKETPNGTQKRAAPISASAFAFSLNTSTPKNKKPNTSTGNNNTPLSLTYNYSQTPLKVKKETTSISQPAFSSQTRLSQTPLRSINPDEEDIKPLNVFQNHTSIETPRKSSSILKPLNAFATPQAKLGDPGPSSSSSKILRRLNDRISDVTPLKEKEKESEIDPKPRFALHETLLPDKTAGDLFSRKRTSLTDDDEGLGVSPRGKRVAKWSVNGPPPPSVHLANLLSSSNASLHLFYTAMQHLLYPSQRGSLSSRLTKTEKSITPSISPLQHIRNSATLHFKLIQPIRGPTHNSTLFQCEPIKWHDISSMPPTQISVVFQPVPNECPKLGVGPRLLALRMNDQRNKHWQVGIWAWSEVELPLTVPTQLDGEGNQIEANSSKELENDRPAIPTRVFIATRYLIVEQPVV